MRLWRDNEKKFKQLINVLRDPRGKNKPPLEVHSHDFIEIEYVFSGSAIQNINGVEYPVKRGDMIFLKKEDYHTYRTDKWVEIINVDFYYSVFDEMCTVLRTYSNGKEIEFPTILHLQGADALYVEDILLKAEKEFENEKIGYYHILKSYLVVLLIYLWRIINDAHIGKNYKFTAIVQYIDENYSNININGVSEHFGYSPNYFSKLFKKNMGITFVEYVNKKRLNKAIELLTTTDKTVDSICAEIGFSDKKHFYEIFKKYVGTTPGSIRQHKGGAV